MFKKSLDILDSKYIIKQYEIKRDNDWYNDWDNDWSYDNGNISLRFISIIIIIILINY